MSLDASKKLSNMTKYLDAQMRTGDPSRGILNPLASHFLSYETVLPAACSCRMRNRWIFPVCVFGSASTNTTLRGYL